MIRQVPVGGERVEVGSARVASPSPPGQFGGPGPLQDASVLELAGVSGLVTKLSSSLSSLCVVVGFTP